MSYRTNVLLWAGVNIQNRLHNHAAQNPIKDIIFILDIIGNKIWKPYRLAEKRVVDDGIRPADCGAHKPLP